VYFSSREPYGRATFAIRTSVPPATLAQPAVAAIRAIDPEQPVGDIRTMVEVLGERLASQRFSALLLAVFAGVALLLAAVGIYSVLSYIVRGRSREIGIRTALGARTSDVLRLVIVEGMSPALVGVAAGTIAALASAKVMRTLVFGVSAPDPLTLTAVGATLVLVASMAGPGTCLPRLAARPGESLARGVGTDVSLRREHQHPGLGSCRQRWTRRAGGHPANGTNENCEVACLVAALIQWGPVCLSDELAGRHGFEPR
jgi:predicted lysophospholipase L1 biosynthesis ABC-type transport system permease subunit